MARRKSRKSKPRRTTTKSINLFNVAEAGLIANAVTQGFFNCSINAFIFSKDGTNTAGATRKAITARELISGITGAPVDMGLQQLLPTPTAVKRSLQRSVNPSATK